MLVALRAFNAAKVKGRRKYEGISDLITNNSERNKRVESCVDQRNSCAIGRLGIYSLTLLPRYAVVALISAHSMSTSFFHCFN